MNGRIRAFLASAKSTRRTYALYYGWGGYEIRRGHVVIYACHDLKEAEAMMLELEMGLK